ncbi:putative nicotinamide N-methyase [Motilibacter peucedani]|uniref:Putative nicotinamide N-methyase n=1 Tax=Motilibacter peucedani TaxID=598650 RepID=A0A420XTV6_9ACTN|nr:50S ribosomal protein L11 methyltransferase [Motilibacter peucedani]RKS80254.1 putative nicotinamide N-methyase [Motilibacter peucedani]
MTPPSATGHPTSARSDAEVREFLLAQTTLLPAPQVPEVQLRQARDMTTLWQRSQVFFGVPDLDPPYWAAAWAGGQAVARHVIDHPALVAGRAVLDLATGSGLCAIAAVQAGASRVTACDIDPVAMVALELNTAANGVEVPGLLADLTAGPPPDVDVVLAGDVCYEPGMAGGILGWLHLCHDAGIEVLLGDPGRDYLPGDGLAELAQVEITGDPMLENAGVHRATVFTLR